ncbi:hypothetical protein RB195_005843 [Necator americanus]|uniref:Uncharacterized protein n=1 Tax=Necator americanus TaxID=51031 RepID=A0ABR1BPY0_NECAM
MISTRKETMKSMECLEVGKCVSIELLYTFENTKSESPKTRYERLSKINLGLETDSRRGTGLEVTFIRSFPFLQSSKAEGALTVGETARMLKVPAALLGAEQPRNCTRQQSPLGLAHVSPLYLGMSLMGNMLHGKTSGKDSFSTEMPSYIRSQQREREKLHCTLLNASKQGDRIVKTPHRYSADDYPPARRSTPRKRKNHDGNPRSKIKNDGQAAHVLMRTAHHQRETPSLNEEETNRSFLSDVDVPTSPMGMRESAQHETSSTPVNRRGPGIDVLIRTQNDATTDARARVGLDENGNVNPFVLPTPPLGTPQPANLLHDPTRNPVWTPYRPQAAALTDNAMMNFYTQQAVSALITSNMIAQNMQQQQYGQLPFLNWNAIPAYNMTQPLLNGHVADCDACVKRTVEVFADHFVNAFVTAVANKFPTGTVQHTCQRHLTDGGVAASRSDSSATIPAYSNTNHDNANTTAVPNNIPKPKAQPAFRPTYLVFAKHHIDYIREY